jgi:hypothetical protein
MYNNIYKEIEQLEDGKYFYWPLLEEAGAEIWKINNRYFVFEIPQYGGEPRYSFNVGSNNIKEIIEKVEKWT